jgi:hypothetical protein
MTSTTYNANGAVAAGPVRSGQRTAADVLADTVSLAVLLALGGFALAVSFSHTMRFVHDHGQRQGWVVVGTALTVVGLTVQAGLETYRDSRAGRGRGWPALLLAVAVVAELYANASTATGGKVARLVAAWPVLVAAAALALWTRRLQHAAEAAEVAGDTVAAMLWDVPQEDRAALAEQLRAGQLVEQNDDQEDEDEPGRGDQLAAARTQGTARDRALRILDRTSAEGGELPGPTELGQLVRCSKQYAGQVITEWKARPENQPGQGALPGVLAAPRCRQAMFPSGTIALTMNVSFTATLAGRPACRSSPVLLR